MGAQRVACRLILLLGKELRPLNGFVVNRVRSLRKRATECEQILWRRLRNRNFAGYKFRRQHPIDPYVLDFYCPAAKLAVELDGGGHNYQTREICDQKRAELLAGHGIKVLRFWNHQVRQELDSILQAIWFELEDRRKKDSSPSPSPFRRERRPDLVDSIGTPN